MSDYISIKSKLVNKLPTPTCYSKMLWTANFPSIVILKSITKTKKKKLKKKTFLGSERIDLKFKL